MPLLTFLSNCVVELYGLDMAATYQHAFVYIRQLAITLRNALANRTKEAFQTVYNWQFVHSLRVWARVLGTYCRRSRPAGPPDSTSPLMPLVYPLIQIILGTARYACSRVSRLSQRACVCPLLTLSFYRGGRGCDCGPLP